MDSNHPRTAPRRKKYVEPYDFKHPKLFSKEIMRTLRTLHEVFARNLSRVFSSALRTKVDVKLMQIDQLATSEFVRHIETPSAIYVLNVEELGGDMVMVMKPGFCIHLVEKQSGGRGQGLDEHRMLTTIEEKIMSRIMKNVNREIIAAWEPIMSFRISSFSYESKPENVHMISADPSIVAVFRVDLGEQSVELKISYPYSLLKESLNESVLQSGSHSRQAKLSEEQLKGYEQTLSMANIRVQPLLGTTTLTIGELMDLEEGDAIALNQKTDQPLEVRIHGVKKMMAYPGTRGNKKAVKIYQILEEINEQELL
ncbi:flagellar motor switch protein FliM [Natronogracilivirga saccharolytica]|uniref:Flagellar motor switch protein FliM n=1 Tax=Natronogracilivirga saccharolytica TaxID=2812953 RepID=A0A8J7USV9_9BACT|nr:FliM/FliN family flagellar motor switch protein [Natronogracilivirga saccharolytica]MBP3191946.1 FliM/FliN family flagellar motor switch protein [Natronogracilivirga saccharolytica]